MDMRMCRTILTTALMLTAWAGRAAPVHQATGIKIGEATADSAIVWTRLTRHPARNLEGPSFDEADAAAALPDGVPLDNMRYAVPGAEGEVRVRYRVRGGPGENRVTPWLAVDANADFTGSIALDGLQPGTAYEVRVECRSPEKQAGPTVAGRFRTAPDDNEAAPVMFTVVTGQDFRRRDDPERGHLIYGQMLNLGPDFFVHTGDIVYYDKPGPAAPSAALARYKWNRMYSLPLQMAFHRQIGSYFIKDDHDVLKDDCWPGQRYGDLTWEQGLAIFREQVPSGERPYRTFRWGKDLQIWLVEGRDFRSPNTAPDGPEKTIWGPDQKAWFKRTVKQSDATFRVLISPTPLVGPDRTNKSDNHANRNFAYEGRELRSFIGGQKGMVVICGDRHWQYVSVDPETGVREYSCGPTSDLHAGGFSEGQRSDMHRYLKIKGGFLSASVRRTDGLPRLTLRHHGTAGQVYHEDVIEAGPDGSRVNPDGRPRATPR